jgi:hypothetical protein
VFFVAMADVGAFCRIDVFQAKRTFIKALLKKFPKCLERIATAGHADGP